MNNSPLENKCSECGGAGGYQDYTGWVDCFTCDGAGYVPTELGEQVLDLIRHNARSRVSVLRSIRPQSESGECQS